MNTCTLEGIKITLQEPLRSFDVLCLTKVAVSILLGNQPGRKVSVIFLQRVIPPSHPSPLHPPKLHSSKARVFLMGFPLFGVVFNFHSNEKKMKQTHTLPFFRFYFHFHFFLLFLLLLLLLILFCFFFFLLFFFLLIFCFLFFFRILHWIPPTFLKTHLGRRKSG